MDDGLPPIKGFLPTSLIEWEGRLSCALFLPGCNFRCPFCHASDLVLRADQIPDVPLAAVIEHLETNRGWVDGAVVSGGEATTHGGLAALLGILHEHVNGVKLDTNGSQPEVVAELVDAGVVNSVAMDVKAPLDGRYEAAAGVPVDAEALRATIRLLRSRGIEHEFRMTVVPGLHTCRDVVAVARELGPSEALVLQQFAPLNCIEPEYLARKPFARAELRDMASAAMEFVARCRLRGEAFARGHAR
jgi:pyruvate formate lyase activating enzyme